MIYIKIFLRFTSFLAEFIVSLEVSHISVALLAVVANGSKIVDRVGQPRTKATTEIEWKLSPGGNINNCFELTQRYTWGKPEDVSCWYFSLQHLCLSDCGILGKRCAWPSHEGPDYLQKSPSEIDPVKHSKFHTIKYFLCHFPLVKSNNFPACKRFTSAKI